MHTCAYASCSVFKLQLFLKLTIFFILTARDIYTRDIYTANISGKLSKNKDDLMAYIFAILFPSVIICKQRLLHGNKIMKYSKKLQILSRQISQF